MNDENLTASISLDFALLLSWQGDRDKALEYCESAMNILKNQPDKNAYREAKRVYGFVRNKKWG